MNRNDTVDGVMHQLLSHQPVDLREQQSIEQFLATVPLLENPCSESSDPRHVTASAIVVSDDGDAVVLHLHKRLNMWLQPGGHVDVGESLADAALREAREETGLPVRHMEHEGLFIHLDVHPGPKGHTHFDVRYVLRAPYVEPRPDIDESPDVRWFFWQEAIALADPGLRGALLAVQALLGKDFTD